MKFADSLTFNAAPELQGHYLAYDQLKSAIYRLEKEAVYEPGGSDLESAGLLRQADSNDPDQSSPAVRIFSALLDKELSNIVEFFQKEEEKLKREVETLTHDVKTIEQSDWMSYEQDGYGSDDSDGSDGGGVSKIAKRVTTLLTAGGSGKMKRRNSRSNKKRRGRAASTTSSASKDNNDSQFPSVAPEANLSEVEEALAEEEAEAPPSPMVQQESRYSFSQHGRAATDDATSVWQSNSDWAIDTRITFKLRMQGLYRELSQLQQFSTMNQTGFKKILKKFDKITDSELQKPYMNDKVNKAYPFLDSTRKELEECIQTVIDNYAKIVARGDKEFALKQLRAQLREEIVFSRNTIWRDMVGAHSKGYTGQGSSSQPVGAGISDGKVASVVKQKLKWKSKELIGGLVGAIAFIVLTNVDTMGRKEESNCLAIIVLAAIFWALEVVPLFVTSLSIPLCVIVLRVIRSADGKDTRLSSHDAAKYIFSQMFSPTIMLLIGGFTLAAALSKHNIDKMLATRVLGFAGTRPRSVLLAYMAVACFASMWISNVAAPVLCYSLIQPILRTLPSKSQFSKALILGIALASNIGGQSSPISSPQNLIALEYMEPPLGWLSWFAIAVPVSSLSIFLIWLLLLWSYSWESSTTVAPMRQSKDKFTAMQYFVSFIVIATIVMWCVSHQLESVFGDMGVIAILPIIAFFGSGALAKSDFENYPWAIVFLAMGGISLGKAVLSSGLLDQIDHVLQHAVRGMDIWPILAIFSVICLVIATIVSHTVASVLIVPIAAQVGAALEVPHPSLLIMSSALICSAGMGLSVSGFPNMTASNMEDEVGNRFLTGNDFLRNGIPASIIATGCVLTVGYLIMRLMGL